VSKAKLSYNNVYSSINAVICLYYFIKQGRGLVSDVTWSFSSEQE